MSDNYKFNPSTGEFEQNKGWNSSNNSSPNDKGVGLWGIFFLLFPYIGVIVYFFMRGSKPNKAKSILYWSIAGGVFMIIGMLNE